MARAATMALVLNALLSTTRRFGGSRSSVGCCSSFASGFAPANARSPTTPAPRSGGRWSTANDPRKRTCSTGGGEISSSPLGAERQTVASANADGAYWQGHGTPLVSREMHAENRARVLSRLRNQGDDDDGGGDSGTSKPLIVVEGGHDQARADTDHELLFRQESNFQYLFGVEMPGCYGAIDVGTGEATLFVPRLPEEYAVWMGTPPTLEEYRSRYRVDSVKYVDELPGFVRDFHPTELYLYGGTNSDSGSPGRPASFEGAENYDADTIELHRALHECRVLKSSREIEILRHANRVASRAHVEVMRRCRPGMMEYQLEATFLHHCYMNGGMRNPAYTPIVGSGPNAAVLHYGHAGAPNNRELEEGDLVLCDLGAEYDCYASDITVTFPVGGTFTPTQRQVYEAVLDAKDSVVSGMKPGVSWIAMHELAEEILARHLIDMGLLLGPLEEAVGAGLPAVFMPHGLGHNLGLETHDVGGVPEGTVRPTRPGLRSLRNVRTLEAGMVLTVEPGCYFIPSEIEKALKDPKMAPYMNEEGLRGMFGFGGVRLEDNVLVTEDGHEVFTDVPRSIDEVEATVGSAYK